MGSTIAGLEPFVDRRHRRWLLHTVTTAALCAIIAVAVVDGLGWWDVYGVDTARVRASADGYELEVRYGNVTRPALATPFDIVVTRAGGFDAPITIAVNRQYLAMWDENGLLPAPTAETTRGEFVEWEFDPPPGDTLVIVYDARIEPAAQSGQTGHVAIVEDGLPIVEVEVSHHGPPLMEIVARATVIFLFLLVLTRGMKRRTLSEMAPFELLLLVTVGDIVQQGITQEDYSLTGAILAVSTFGFWITILTYLTWRSRRVAAIVDGVPLVIVQDGQPIERTLAAERLPLDEVLEAARQRGIEHLDNVKLAVLEPSGRISFITNNDADG